MRVSSPDCRQQNRTGIMIVTRLTVLTSLLVVVTRQELTSSFADSTSRGTEQRMDNLTGGQMVTSGQRMTDQSSLNNDTEGTTLVQGFTEGTPTRISEMKQQVQFHASPSSSFDEKQKTGFGNDEGSTRNNLSIEILEAIYDYKNGSGSSAYIEIQETDFSDRSDSANSLFNEKPKTLFPPGKKSTSNSSDEKETMCCGSNETRSSSFNEQETLSDQENKITSNSSDEQQETGFSQGNNTTGNSPDRQQETYFGQRNDTTINSSDKQQETVFGQVTDTTKKSFNEQQEMIFCQGNKYANTHGIDNVTVTADNKMTAYDIDISSRVHSDVDKNTSRSEWKKRSMTSGEDDFVVSSDAYTNSTPTTIMAKDEITIIKTIIDMQKVVQDSETGMNVFIRLGDVEFTVCDQQMLCAKQCFKSDTITEQRNVREENSDKMSHYLNNDYNALLSEETTTMNAARPWRSRVGNSQHLVLPEGDDKKGKLDSNFIDRTAASGDPNRRTQIGDSINMDLRLTQAYIDYTPSCSKVPNGSCFCDEVCVLYGDCCPDVFTNCFKKYATNDIIQFISNTWIHHFGFGPTTPTTERQPQTSDGRLINLLVEFASCIYTDETTGMVLVNSCPREQLNLTLRRQCQNSTLMNLPPVTVRFPYGDVGFQNLFCAQCHDIPEADIKPWDRTFSCVPAVWHHNSSQGFTIKDLEELTSKGECNMTFTPPKGSCRPRLCSLDSFVHHKLEEEILSAIVSGECTAHDGILCRSYHHPMPHKRNEHCRRCLNNTNGQRRAETRVPCSLFPHISLIHSGIGSSRPSGGILIVLDIMGSYSLEPDPSGFYACKNTEVYDPYTSTCRTLVCRTGAYPHRGTCKQLSQASIADGFKQLFPDCWSDITATIVSDREIGNCVFFTPMSDSVLPSDVLDENNSKCIRGTRPDSVSALTSSGCEIFLEDIPDGRQIISDILKWVFTSTSQKTDQIPTITRKPGNLGKYADFFQIEVSNINSSTATSHVCSGDNTLHQLWHFNIVESNNTAYVLVNISHRAIYYPLRNIGFQVIVSLDSNRSVLRVLNQSVYVCDTWVSLRGDCSGIKHSLNETIQNGSGLMMLHSGVFYDAGDFEINGDEVIVCSKMSSHCQSSTIQQNLPYLILSWVLTCVSIFFLSLMLVLYCLLPELCTLPGKMTASLAATMMMTFLSNLLTLVDLHHDYVCPLAAALSHLVTLAQFGWMSAIAVNMALTFGPLANTLVRTVTDRNLFLRYNLVVWGSSMTLVMTSVTLDLTHREPINNTNQETVPLDTSTYPRYGFPFCTWFSGPLWSKLAFVLIPYLVTFIISLVGFLLTLIGIQQTSKTARKLGKNSSDKARCMIYFKLSSAMGFAWAISALDNLYPISEIILYVYQCLVLLQGFCLFLAFMVNHRVFQLVRKRLTLRLGKHSQRKTTISSVLKHGPSEISEGVIRHVLSERRS